MAEFGFYHLTRSTAEQVLPALLSRTLAEGERALVCCASAERLAALDSALWLSPQPEWLPHGSERDGDADLQPIWLAIGAPRAPPNNARFLFLLDSLEAGEVTAFSRVFDLFDGRDKAALAGARERWKRAKAQGHSLSYWQEGERGWERKV